LRWATLV